jgi:hypothetical protein
MQCNIDGRGRRWRAISGVVCLAAAIGLLAWSWPADRTTWIAAGILAAVGAFQLFEARRGWCVLRAMGWRTPL